MKKKLMVQTQCNKDYSHFDAILKKDSVKLKYAKTSEWTPRVSGKDAVELVSDGNGVDVSIYDPNRETKTFRLNYSELEQLRIAIHLFETDREQIFGNPKFVTKLRKFWGG